MSTWQQCGPIMTGRIWTLVTSHHRKIVTLTPAILTLQSPSAWNELNFSAILKFCMAESIGTPSWILNGTDIEIDMEWNINKTSAVLTFQFRIFCHALYSLKFYFICRMSFCNQCALIVFINILLLLFMAIKNWNWNF